MNSKLLWLPVSDVDRGKRFYEMLGWRLDADFTTGDDFSGGAVYTSRLGVLDHFLKAQQVSSRRRAMSQRPNRSRRGSYSYIFRPRNHCCPFRDRCANHIVCPTSHSGLTHVTSGLPE